MKDSNLAKQAPKDNKAEIINAVKTPLGFFTLTVLLVEVVFGIVASMSSGNDKTYLINGMMILIFVLVFIVAGMAVFRPTALYGKPETSKEKAISTDKALEKMNELSKKFDDYIEKDVETENITSIVDDTLEHTRDTWLKLLLIRITLRRLLLKVASANAMSFAPATSISRMISEFRNAGIIDQYLYAEVEKIRDATYTVEWGLGVQSDLSNIKFTLEKYGDVFSALKKRMHPKAG